MTETPRRPNFHLFLSLTWARESSLILSIFHRIQGRMVEWAQISRYFSVYACPVVIYTQKWWLHIGKHHTTRLPVSKIQTRNEIFFLPSYSHECLVVSVDSASLGFKLSVGKERVWYNS